MRTYMSPKFVFLSLFDGSAHAPPDNRLRPTEAGHNASTIFMSYTLLRPNDLCHIPELYIMLHHEYLDILYEVRDICALFTSTGRIMVLQTETSEEYFSKKS